MRKPTAETSPRLLVVAPSWLGDTVMASPAIRRLAEASPRRRISILAKPSLQGLWRGFPGVSEVIPYEKAGGLKRWSGFSRAVKEVKSRGFQEALIFPQSFSSALLTVLADIPVRIGFSTEGRDGLLTRAVSNAQPRSRHVVLEYLDLVTQGMDLPPARREAALFAVKTGEGEREGRKLLKEMKIPRGKGLIALVPGATYGPAKRWPMDSWRELMKGLLGARKESLILLGGPGEKILLEPLLNGWTASEQRRVGFGVGRTTPEALSFLFRISRMAISNDTGPMHLAAAVGTPVLGIFGSTSPLWTRPFGLGHRVVRLEVPCNPCFRRKCPIGTVCLRRLNPSLVLREALDLLSTAE